MIELTPEQRQELDQGRAIDVIDRETSKPYWRRRVQFNGGPAPPWFRRLHLPETDSDPPDIHKQM